MEVDMNALLHYLVAFVALTSILACNNQGVDSKQDLELKNTVWKLQSFEAFGIGITPIQDNRLYLIAFLPDTIAQIRADCNTCTASYRLIIPESNARLVLTLHSCTEMYCGPESLDHQFLDGLRNAESYEIDGNLLRIYHNQKNNIMNFRRHQ
jgi:heat shock protein HslJ